MLKAVQESFVFLEPYNALLMPKLHLVGRPHPFESELYFKVLKEKDNNELVSLKLHSRVESHPAVMMLSP